VDFRLCAMEGVALNRRFWEGRRVFITGHTGFKGGWLSLWLEELGARVTGYSLGPPTEPSLFELAAVSDGLTSLTGDIRDAGALAEAVAVADPEVVFHLAAQPLVRDSYRRPVETYSTNVLGTVHLLEAVRHAPAARAVVIVTTDKCYEDDGTGAPHSEGARLGGHDPYSSSKASAELVTSAYRASFLSDGAAAVATARAGNVIGGGDWAADRLIPDAVRAWSRGETLRVRYPAAVRPWQHVLDPLHGYLLLAQRLWEQGQALAEAWNFGPDESDSREVRWVVERVGELWGEHARWAQDPAASPHETMALRLDCSKAKTRLGWQPLLRLPDALDLTVQWYRRYAGGGAMGGVTREQIRAFQQRVS
jgi:CDP-glucose 4,6-dehydratase